MVDNLSDTLTHNPPALDPKDAWQKTLFKVKSELSEQSYSTWISPVQFSKFENGTAFLEVPDRFYADWVKDHYQDIIRSALSDVLGEKIQLSYIISDKTFKFAAETSVPLPKKVRPENLGMNGRYNFDNFVIGPGNRFAHAAAVAVSQAPAKNYNPLFIYGSVGLGKTHLMQAVAHSILERNSEAKVVYISGENFTNQLISAIQGRSTHQFRMKYRNSDVLLVDDIHFIAGKESTQEEFFHTFNCLHDAHKQIIVCSDRPPKEIPGLEDRLISRFGWGLVADIQPPEFETRVAILKKKMEQETVSVPDEVVFFIANKIKSNIRELEGALVRVVAYTTLTGILVNKKVAEEILKDCFKEEVINVTIERIQKNVCDYFKIKISDLRVKNRSRSVSYPRQIAMYLVRELTTYSLPEIGEYFGGRGHATVIHGCNKIEHELSLNGKTKRVVDELKLLIKEG